MINIGTVIDNRYEILKEIDRGGMSIVYLAADDRLKKSVVLKDIRKGNKINSDILLECLKAEADLLTFLDHPNLPKIYDIIEGDNHIYVVMDYVEGESLKKKIDREKKCDSYDVIEWGKQLSDVLNYLHSRQPTPIIYRDMKPHNIMLTPEGKIKLIDFGISIKMDKQNGKLNFGTSTYAAPEQLEGKITDGRTDIYSLGVTLYQLVTGLTFKSNLNLKPIRQINPAYPEGLEQIINKCIKENPQDRYQKAEELLYDFENIDKLSKSYKKKQIKKMALFLISFTLLIASSTMTIVGYKGLKNNKYNDYQTLINEAGVSYLDKEYTKSIEILNKAITDVDGSLPDAYVNLLDIYIDMGDTNTGLSKVESYINGKYEGINENNTVLFKVAMTYLNNKNYPIALKYFKQVNAKKVPDAKYYVTIASSMSNMNVDYNDLQGEIDEFEKYVDSLPNDDKKLANYKALTIIYGSYKGQIQGANDKIIEIIEKANSILENIGNIQLNLRYEVDYTQKMAEAYQSKGIKAEDKETAKNYYDNALKLYNSLLDLEVKNKEEVLIKIADIYTETKDYQTAVEKFTGVIKSYPQSIQAYSKLINALVDLEQTKGNGVRNYTTAKDYYSRASKISGADDSAEFKKLTRRLRNLEII
ncbi:protein kinase [Clostridium sp. SHJSY1]|uniref:protein kinase domain-containing protein n=1 Tax=Clostridium sp. SHJSY1 TaxID=2942483 RepID=UPI002875D541|nr:protein kinase [Clostridium sp. SHJSY1]MDS0525605.1 protein kinase [Clostridium sp. SHJSY1]